MVRNPASTIIVIVYLLLKIIAVTVLAFCKCFQVYEKDRRGKKDDIDHSVIIFEEKNRIKWK